jgi:hypothetical protein
VKTIHINGTDRSSMMTTIDITPPPHRRRDRDEPGMFARAEMWLDERGKWAWIAATVGGFVIFWPVGLGLAAYMIWSKRMFSKHNHDYTSWTASGQNGGVSWSACSGNHRDRSRQMYKNMRAAMRPSGNEAFDAYKTDMLRRLEEEQAAFEEFLGRLRAAKDKAEFDQFMADRANQNGGPADDGQDRAA